jgi:hypothetical protein
MPAIGRALVAGSRVNGASADTGRRPRIAAPDSAGSVEERSTKAEFLIESGSSSRCARPRSWYASSSRCASSSWCPRPRRPRRPRAGGRVVILVRRRAGARPRVGIRVPLHSQVRADVHRFLPEEPRAAGHPAHQNSVPTPTLSYRHEIRRRPDRGRRVSSWRSAVVHNHASPNSAALLVSGGSADWQAPSTTRTNPPVRGGLADRPAWAHTRSGGDDLFGAH